MDGARAVYVQDTEGAFASYVIGAPDFVNATFAARWIAPEQMAAAPTPTPTATSTPAPTATPTTQWPYFRAADVILAGTGNSAKLTNFKRSGDYYCRGDYRGLSPGYNLRLFVRISTTGRTYRTESLGNGIFSFERSGASSSTQSFLTMAASGLHDMGAQTTWSGSSAAVGSPEQRLGGSSSAPPLVAGEGRAPFTGKSPASTASASRSGARSHHCGSVSRRCGGSGSPSGYASRSRSRASSSAMMRSSSRWNGCDSFLIGCARTAASSESPLDLRGEYVVRWRGYSRPASGNGGEFRYLLLDVAEGLRRTR